MSLAAVEVEDCFDEPLDRGMHNRTRGCLRQYPDLSNLAPSYAGLVLSSMVPADVGFCSRVDDYSIEELQQ